MAPDVAGGASNMGEGYNCHPEARIHEPWTSISELTRCEWTVLHNGEKMRLYPVYYKEEPVRRLIRNSRYDGEDLIE